MCRMSERQRGFALFELIVAALIATLLAVWASDALVRRTQEASVEAVAAWMSTAKAGVGQYIGLHGDALRQATMPQDLAAQGFVDWRAPTLSELKLSGVLSASFPEVYGRNLQLGVQLLRQGDCPGDTCMLEAIVHTTSPLDVFIGGRVNEAILAYWAMATKGQGGVVQRANPAQIAGPGFAFVNPPTPEMPLLGAGTVVMAQTQAGSSNIPYLQVGDSRDPQFAAGMTVSGSIASGASLRAQESLWLGTQAIERTPCDENGLITREAYGGLLVCRGYQWVSAGGKGGGGYAVNTVSGCSPASANPATGGCSCPAGYASVLISDSGPKADTEGRTRGYLCTG